MSKQSKAILILAIILLLSLAGNYFQFDSAKTQQSYRYAQNLQFQNAEKAGRLRMKALQDSITALQDKRVFERDSAQAAQGKLIADIDGYKKVITKLRPIVQPRIDSVPDLRRFVLAQDSVIVKQDSLITSLELRHEAEIIDLEEIVRLMRHQVQEQVGITNSLQEQILFEQGETRRERRWKKIWKGATVVVTVTAATVVTIISLK